MVLIESKLKVLDTRDIQHRRRCQKVSTYIIRQESEFSQQKDLILVLVQVQVFFHARNVCVT